MEVICNKRRNYRSRRIFRFSALVPGSVLAKTVVVISFLLGLQSFLWQVLLCPAHAQDSGSKKSISTYDDVEIEKWEFGVVTDPNGDAKDWRLHPIVVVPNLPGIQYGWKLRVKRDNVLFVKEEFTLPESPSTWKIKQGDSSSELKNGGQQCIIESFQTADDGWIGHIWTASVGDPAGKYEIKVWLNGKLAHVFTFNVGEGQLLESGLSER